MDTLDTDAYQAGRPPGQPPAGAAGAAASEAAPRDARAGVTALYEAHAIGLIRLAFVMLGDPAAAEDAVQEAFIGVYRRWDQLADPASALPYARSAVLNQCRNALRRQSRGRALVVGDTVTGKAVARFAPPAHQAFVSVSAAADDRTFVAYSMPPSGPFSSLVATWYEVRLTPGATTPARLTRLPIAPAADVVATALSGSGRELAVGFANFDSGSRGLFVYSTATGRLLKSWHARSGSALVPNGIEGAVTRNVYLPTVSAALTWIDGDRAIAFATPTVQTRTGFTVTGMSVRRLDMADMRGGDLMADSRVIWSAHAPGHPGAGWSSAADGCILGDYPLVSADGSSVFCPTGDMVQARATGRLALKVLAYPATSPVVGRARYQVTLPWAHESAQTGAGLTPLWTDPAGRTVLIEWFVQRIDGTVPQLHFGYVTDGRFTPVRVPVSTRLPYPPIIAW